LDSQRTWRITFVILDACRGVDATSQKEALVEMVKAGVQLILSTDL
jgi:hypothetical protein